jgi:hypothetical protein
MDLHKQEKYRQLGEGLPKHKIEPSIEKRYPKEFPIQILSPEFKTELQPFFKLDKSIFM